MRLLFLLLIVAAAAVLTLAPRASDPLEHGLVAHYTFNRCDARDDSGGSSNGELFGTMQCWCGIEGNGLLFDGQSGYVTFQGIVNDYFTSSDFTLSFFIKPESRSVFPFSLLSKREDCGNDHLLDVLLDFERREVTTLVRESAYSGYHDLSPGLPDGAWLHFALVREGQRARTYINGLPQMESFLCRGVDISNTARLAFGDSPCIRTGRARRFRGILDELRVYDRALSEAEIGAIYRRTPIESATMDCVTYRIPKNPYEEPEYRYADANLRVSRGL